MIASMRRFFLFPGAQAAADFVYHPFDGVFVEVVDGFGQQVGQLRRRRDEARGIDDDPGVGQLGQALQFLRLVPAEFEITGDLLDQAGPGTAPVSMFQGRYVTSYRDVFFEDAPTLACTKWSQCTVVGTAVRSRPDCMNWRMAI